MSRSKENREREKKKDIMEKKEMKNKVPQIEVLQLSLGFQNKFDLECVFERIFKLIFIH